MPDTHDYSLEIQVIDREGQQVLTHSSHQHSRAGACIAYGHALIGLMQHYRDDRQLQEGNTHKGKAPRKIPGTLAAAMPEDPDRAL